METHSLAMDLDTHGFYLRLPAPHDLIILTCPRLEDAEDIPPILNDDRVYPWMGLPHPHQQEHALRWLKSVKAKCDIGQEDVRRVKKENLISICECPVRIIREIKDGHEPVYLGDCGITRWAYPDVQDEKQRQSLKEENLKKDVGDPTVIWSIGYYLAPSHSAQGIMSAVIKTLIGWAVANMNVRHMRTTAMEGNEPSIRVLKRNGFTVEKTLQDFALKKGQKVGLHVLEWKAPSSL